MIDLHSHILPEIDDGAKDMDVSIEMLKKAQADGITDMCVTPHYIYGSLENTSSVIEKKLNELKQLSISSDVNIKMYPGNEIYLSPQVPNLIKAGTLMTLNAGRYALVELPEGMLPDYINNILFDILLKGYIPVIAHPERSYDILERQDLKLWKNQEIVFQINASSITGLFGKRIQRHALELISQGYAGIVASDCHTNRNRSPILSKARKIVDEKFGYDVSEKLLEYNCKCILNSKEIVNIAINRKRTFFSIFMGRTALLN